jgi:O-antigen ligase
MLVLLCVLGVGLSVGGYLLLRVKPMSCAGRAVIWSVTSGMATQSSFSGVGFSNLANTYHLFQAEYFAKGGGSIAQRMAADACRHAFNEPLEVAAELGIPGLVLLLLFAGLILNAVWKVVRRNSMALGCASVDGATVRQCSVFGIQYSVKEEQRQEYPNPVAVGGTAQTPPGTAAAAFAARRPLPLRVGIG